AGPILFIDRISPAAAYLNALELVVAESTVGGAPPGEPVYLGGWAMVLVLLVWIVVPVAFGIRRFDGAEI
ncbi:hypothetical protein BRD17_00120, partial [Halobacteriales archaeon SW_7_68_16]